MSSFDEPWKAVWFWQCIQQRGQHFWGQCGPISSWWEKLSFSIHPTGKEGHDMQQGLEEDQSLMLDMHKGVRPFTQPYLSYESIQRASCNPILEHIRSAFMKMLCMLRKDSNIPMWHIFVPVHRGIFWWLEVCISTEQKNRKTLSVKSTQIQNPFHFCLWSSCEQGLKNTWLLTYYQDFYHSDFLGLETKIQKYLPSMYLTLFICGIFTFHRIVLLPESLDKKKMHTLSACVHLHHSRNDQSFKNAQIG